MNFIAVKNLFGKKKIQVLNKYIHQDFGLCNTIIEMLLKILKILKKQFSEKEKKPFLP